MSTSVRFERQTAELARIRRLGVAPAPRKTFAEDVREGLGKPGQKELDRKSVV